MERSWSVATVNLLTEYNDYNARQDTVNFNLQLQRPSDGKFFPCSKQPMQVTLQTKTTILMACKLTRGEVEA